MPLEDPKANTYMPVYVPGDNGELKLEVAKAKLKSGTLVIEFNDRLPALAIQRMLARDIEIGLIVVNLNDLEDTPEEEATPDGTDEASPAEG